MLKKIIVSDKEMTQEILQLCIQFFPKENYNITDNTIALTSDFLEKVVSFEGLEGSLAKHYFDYERYNWILKTQNLSHDELVSLGDLKKKIQQKI